jgi:hypothetical protein
MVSDPSTPAGNPSSTSVVNSERETHDPPVLRLPLSMRRDTRFAASTSGTACFSFRLDAIVSVATPPSIRADAPIAIASASMR